MPKKQSQHYRHKEATAVLRPESGSQDTFPQSKRKPPQEYRFDSSLAPELFWDENPSRSEAEKYLADILAANSIDDAKKAATKLKDMSNPFLNWTGKAEKQNFITPSLPLFVHERLSVEAILKTLEKHKRNRQIALNMFGEGQKDIADARANAYTHQNGWQNRLILGDSLQVMNSLLTYEYMGGKVQMIYMDPPYGIQFGSNFQPFVRKRDVKDGDDKELTREPEMVKAYRDTWELGIHSWLSYMRERLFMAREMLTDSGSCFVQISDDNVHLVRSIMDEVFGRENFIAEIILKTRSTSLAHGIATLNDFIIWYAKDKERVKYTRLFTKQKDSPALFSLADINGEVFSRNELSEEQLERARFFKTNPLVQSAKGIANKASFEFQGKIYEEEWRCTVEGLNQLAKKNRIYAPQNPQKDKTTITYKYFHDDFPYEAVSNFWDEQISEKNKKYVVQTAEKAIMRCILMTTDPGDLVFDPTCGSGSTAVVAEQWGRRWITADVSRVPLAIARQRLLTTTYDYYQLQSEERGPVGGFVYTRKPRQGEEVGGIVPHTTLKSIANNTPPAEEVLVDKPEKNTSYVRITGPFCVEAIMPPAVGTENGDKVEIKPDNNYGEHIARMIGVLKQSPLLRLHNNKTLEITNIRPPAKSMNLHAEAQANDEQIAIIFGAANAAISELDFANAAKEANNKNFSRLLVIGFAIDPAARRAIEKSESAFNIAALYAQASSDLTMVDLLKNTRASQIFAVCGMPDVRLSESGEKNKDGELLYEVELRGLDILNPVDMETTHKGGNDVPCWMLDPDYDGECFRAGQVFFPRTGAWDKIKQAIKADFDDSVWEHLQGAISAPFVIGESKCVAVKVIDDRGNELMTVKTLEEVE